MRSLNAAKVSQLYTFGISSGNVTLRYLSHNLCPIYCYLVPHSRLHIKSTIRLVWSTPRNSDDCMISSIAMCICPTLSVSIPMELICSKLPSAASITDWSNVCYAYDHCYKLCINVLVASIFIDLFSSALNTSFENTLTKDGILS